MPRGLRASLIAVAAALGGAAAVMAVTVVAAPAARAQDSAASPAISDAAGLRVLSTQWRDDRLLEVQASTPALREPTRFRVLLPTGYGREPERRFPVLYLLHGGGDDYRYWTDKADVAQIIGDAPVIVVMPDGGFGGWYADWFNSGVGGPPQWERFHIQQLLPWVDAIFRTRADRDGRAIAGLSMGGFGAMSYAARHPELFAAAASFSGAVDILNPKITTIVDLSPIPTLNIPTSVFGPRLLNEQRWREHNPTDLANRLRGMDLAIYTGNGHPGPYDQPTTPPDIQESTVHEASLALHRALQTAGISHRLVDYGPGTHTTPYWRRDLGQELPHILATLNTGTRAGQH